MYYNRLKHSKIVISDFHLAKLENGLIKEPCGTPEYLGKMLFKTDKPFLKALGTRTADGVVVVFTFFFNKSESREPI